MTVNEKLAARVREALASVSRVEEKRMFGGVAFMVNGKMCVTVGRDRIMCRVDPARTEELTRMKGCSLVKMRGREYRGYVRVSEQVLDKMKDLHFWIGLALDFNDRAKATRRKK